LTTDDIGDATALRVLLDQIDGPVALFLADGAYDGEPTVKALTDRFGALIKVTIPPPKNAVMSAVVAQNPSILPKSKRMVGWLGRIIRLQSAQPC
jgi:hypothetical protein